jgi:hypothetical protein
MTKADHIAAVVAEKDAEIARLLSINAKLLAALRAVLVMWNVKEPRKLDEALTWRQNDERALAMAENAIAEAAITDRTDPEGGIPGRT